MGSADVRFQEVFARREAFLYRISGLSSAVPLTADEHAHRTMQFLAGCNAYFTQGPGSNLSVDWGTLVNAGESYLWIKDSPALSAAEHTLARNLLIMLDQRHQTLEKGAMNRSMGIAASRKI